MHWESLLSGSDVDKLFSTFYNKLNNLINKQAPHYPNAKLTTVKIMVTKGLENLQGLGSSFSFLVIEISIKFIEIKYCTFLELVKEHFITIILRKMYAI